MPLTERCHECGCTFDNCYCDSIDTCVSCGGTCWAHAGVRAWDQEKERSIAPQLCIRCWQEQGYPWPEKIVDRLTSARRKLLYGQRECAWCHEKFESADALINHVWANHPSTNRS